MKIEISRLSFLDILVKCNKIVDPKAIVPSLQGLYITTTNDELTITSSNNINSIKIRIKNDKYNLKIHEAGSLLIKGKHIIEILRKMEDDNILLSNEEPNVLYLKGDNNEFFINLMNNESYPEISFKENGQSCVVSGSEIKKAINQTMISVDEYNQKIVLTGLSFKIMKNMLYVFGADQFRVSRKIIELDRQYDSDFESNIPLKSCVEVSKIFMDNDKVKVIFNQSHVVFKNDEVIFQSTVLEGNYPDINKVYPTDFNSSIFVDKNKIIRLISRADIRDEDMNGALVNLIIEDEKLVIKSNNQQIGSFTEEFTEFELRGIDDQNVYFNAKFMLDALRTFDTESVELNLIESMKPIILTSIQDLRLSHIILPVGIK